MFDAALIIAAVAVGLWGLRRARWGAPPSRPLRMGRVVAMGITIQIGFHALATAAPSIGTTVVLVLFGWVAFTLWSVWLSRAPTPGRGDARGDDGRGGGPDDGDGDGPDSRGGDEHTIDWDAFEREFWPHVDREPARRD